MGDKPERIYPDTIFCEKCGYTPAKIKYRLATLTLTERDHELSKRLHEEVIVPFLEPIREEYYSIVPGFSEFIDTFAKRDDGDQLLKQLKSVFNARMLVFGVNFDTMQYFNDRMSLGMYYAQLGTPLSLYPVSINLVEQLLIAYIPKPIKDKLEEYEPLVQYIVKMSALDACLTIQAYHLFSVEHLEVSLTHLQQVANELQLKATTDELTGLLNHGAILRAAQKALDEAQAQQQPLSFLMADIDFFKKVNDTYGHQAGDAVLHEVATRMRASARDGDVLGRYGGEEFLAILPNADQAQAKRVAADILRGISAAPIKVDGTLDIPITISLGVAALNCEQQSDHLIKRADDALYAAKTSGRNRVAESI